MKPMIRNQFTTDSRGQALILGAIIVAISLVALVVILNSVLFAGNLAAQSPTAETNTVKDYHNSFYHEHSKLLILNNDKDDGLDVDLLEDQYQNEAEMTNEIIFEQVADSQSTLIDAEIEEINQGQLIRHADEDRPFTSAEDVDGDTQGDWEVADNINDIRRFQFDVDANDLPGEANAFTVLVNPEYDTDEDGNEFLDSKDLQVELYNSGGDPVVRVEDSNGDVETFTESADRVVVDVTTGEIKFGDDDELASNPDQFDFPDESSYDIEYQNGDEVNGGQYVLVGTNVSPGMVNLTAGSSPYMTGAIYSMELAQTHQTGDKYVERTMEVAPCEPDEDSCPVEGLPALNEDG